MKISVLSQKSLGTNGTQFINRIFTTKITAILHKSKMLNDGFTAVEAMKHDDNSIIARAFK